MGTKLFSKVDIFDTRQEILFIRTINFGEKAVNRLRVAKESKLSAPLLVLWLQQQTVATFGNTKPVTRSCSKIVSSYLYLQLWTILIASCMLELKVRLVHREYREEMVFLTWILCRLISRGKRLKMFNDPRPKLPQQPLEHDCPRRKLMAVITNFLSLLGSRSVCENSNY